MFALLFKNTASFGRNRIPAQLVIQMTNHCNAQCPQCGMRTTAKIPRAKLCRDEIQRILDAAGRQGVQAVSFTGGEPFLFQEDLIHLIEYAGRAGTQTPWPFGNDPAAIAQTGNVADVSISQTPSRTMP